MMSAFLLVSIVLGFIVNWASFLVSAVLVVILGVMVGTDRKKQNLYKEQISEILSKFDENYINEELAKASCIKLPGRRVYLTDNLVIRNYKGLMFVGKYEDLVWSFYKDEQNEGNDELTGNKDDEIVVSLFDKELRNNVMMLLINKGIEIQNKNITEEE